MTRPKVFVTRLIPTAGLDLLTDVCEADVWTGELPPPYGVLVARVSECVGLLTLLTDRIDAAVMEAAGPTLRVISNFAVGVDNIDVAEATRRGIAVGNTPGVLTETTADLAWALLMAAARRVVEGDQYVRAERWKTWEPQLLLGPDVAGATLGIFGFGRIGQAMARRAQGFNMRVLYTTRRHVPPLYEATEVDFATLLHDSDFVTIHSPLTTATRHLFNHEAFARMKPGSVLINTARGPLVDQTALYAALVNGQIAAAALDVTEPEPVAATDPLLQLPNCLIVPHIGSASIATRNRMAEMAAHNLLAGISGERLPHCANSEVYAV